MFRKELLFKTLDPLSASSRIRLAIVRVLIAMPLSGAVPGYVETDFILALCLSSHAPRLLGQNLSNTVLLCLPDAQNHSWQQRSFRAPAARQAQLRWNPPVPYGCSQLQACGWALQPAWVPCQSWQWRLNGPGSWSWPQRQLVSAQQELYDPSIQVALGSGRHSRQEPWTVVNQLSQLWRTPCL